MTVECAATLDHHQKAHIISGCAHQSATTGEEGYAPDVLRVGGCVDQFQPIGAAVIRGETPQFLRRHVEPGIFHLERLENRLLQKLVEVLATDDLDYPT